MDRASLGRQSGGPAGRFAKLKAVGAIGAAQDRRECMDLLPPLHLGVLNGWLLLVAYFLGLVVSVLAFPADKRKKLFLEPQYPRGHPRWLALSLGRVAAVSFVVLTLFTELRLGTPAFYLGMILYGIGYAVVMVSLNDYKRAPAHGLVKGGLYRYSRNPQWLGLVGVFVGTVLAMGAGLHLVLVLILVAVYHFQILLEEEVCASAYGAEYREYMDRVPRYLLV
jgi:protein-S-isoprenylcysteine O-methyltransferase Ste14